jgi:hypothetical protein
VRHNIGFLKNPKRFNVAVTRAQVPINLDYTLAFI